MANFHRLGQAALGQGKSLLAKQIVQFRTQRQCLAKNARIMETVVLEHRFTDRPFEVEQYGKTQADIEWCLNLHGVRHVTSYLSPDGRRMICVFKSPDAEAVRNMSAQLGYSYDQLWKATVVE